MKCNKCKNHKQLTHEEFNSLPFNLVRQVDCKELIPNNVNQCTCYSIEHATDKKEIKDLLDCQSRSKSK